MVEDRYLDNVLDNIDIEERTTEGNTLIKNGEEAIKNKTPRTLITDRSRDEAVKAQLVPKGYKNLYFDRKKILDAMKKRNEIENLSPMYEDVFNKYADTCEEILTTFRQGDLPPRSYIIGAPPDLGLQSFVTECILEMYSRGLRAVPYLTLYELATVKNVQAKVLEKPIKLTKKDGLYTETLNEIPEFIKRPEIIYGRYSFSEYINSDCLFLRLSDATYKEIESRMLRQVLTIRGMKGLPTIVTLGISLDYYRRDRELEEYVWRDITTKDPNNMRYDMVYYISCYRADVSMSQRNYSIDKETGLIKT